MDTERTTIAERLDTDCIMVIMHDGVKIDLFASTICSIRQSTARYGFVTFVTAVQNSQFSHSAQASDGRIHSIQALIALKANK